MTAPAWMPLYIADYLADTAHLSAAEHGAYLLLIMHYWRAGSLPHDDKKLARIARCTDRQWRDMRDTIAGLFGPDWSHKRVENELDKARSKSQARSEAGKHGAEAKSLKNKDAPQAIACDLPEQKPAIVQASSSEPQSERKIEGARKRAAPAQLIPPTWEMDEDDLSYAIDCGMDMGTAVEQQERFKDRSQAKGEKYVSIKAAWRTWCRNWRDWRNAPQPKLVRA